MISGHWMIENQLHRVRDVIVGEDTFHRPDRYRNPTSWPPCNLAISILRLTGRASIAAAAALRRTARDPTRAFRLLTHRP